MFGNEGLDGAVEPQALAEGAKKAAGTTARGGERPAGGIKR